MEVIRFLDQEFVIIRHPRKQGLLLSMHPDKNISVKTNVQTSQKQILNFLISKKNWIEKNINKFKKLKEQFAVPTAVEGSYFPFLGELKYLKFSETTSRNMYFKIEEGFLICYRPNDTEIVSLIDEAFFDKLKIFYKTEAEIYLKNKLIQWSMLTGLVPLKLSFRLNQTRWGSCSSSKHISLNWKLICQSSLLIDYVIVHELCHLRHLNHSNDFWNLVESYLPSYKEVEKVLRQQERLGHFLN